MFFTGKYRDIDGMNEERADSVQEALNAFQFERGLKGEDAETVISDFLSNLLHLAYCQDIDIRAILRRGMSNFEQESNLSLTFEIAAPSLGDADDLAHGREQNAFRNLRQDEDEDEPSPPASPLAHLDRIAAEQAAHYGLTIEQHGKAITRLADGQTMMEDDDRARPGEPE